MWGRMKTNEIETGPTVFTFDALGQIYYTAAKQILLLWLGIISIVAPYLICRSNPAPPAPIVSCSTCLRRLLTLLFILRWTTADFFGRSYHRKDHFSGDGGGGGTNTTTPICLDRVVRGRSK